MPIAGKLGAVYVTDGITSSVAFTDEVTNASADNKRYIIAASTKKYWDDSAAVTVKKNGTVVSSGYSIEYAGGVVVFNTALTEEDVVTVSGKYFTVNQCATFFNWKLDTETDLKEVTTFSSNGWKEYLATISGWSASAEGYYADSKYAGLLGKRILLVLYVDSTSNKRYEGYILLKKNSIQEAVDDVVKESVDLQGTGQIYYHEV